MGEVFLLQPNTPLEMSGPDAVSQAAIDRIVELTSHFIPLICYEVLFPELVRTFFGGPENPGFIVNQTQDGWFGNSMETFQHFELGRMRAIEFRRALVRATTSGFVDLAGNHATPLAGPVFTPGDAKAFQVWDVPVNCAAPTFYARHGNAWMLLVLFFFSVFRSPFYRFPLYRPP